MKLFKIDIRTLTEKICVLGDSGGGLMSRNADGVWFLHGIVSTGIVI